MYCGKEQEKGKPVRIEKILKKLKKGRPDENLLLDLSDEFRKNWDLIKERNLLTLHVIDVMRENKNPSRPNYIVNRVSGDSRSGGLFEDLFGQMFERYLQSDLDLWDGDDFLLDIEVNTPTNIPGEPRKKKLDVIVRLKKTSALLMVLQLKSSYTKRSLRRYYDVEREMFNKISPDLDYYYVIFNASKLKSKTYKNTVDNCKVLCYDFKTDNDSMEKMIQPKIVDPVEDVFDDFKQLIKSKLTGDILNENNQDNGSDEIV